MNNKHIETFSDHANISSELFPLRFSIYWCFLSESVFYFDSYKMIFQFQHSLRIYPWSSISKVLPSFLFIHSINFHYGLVHYFLNGSNSLFWCSNGLIFGQREPLQGSSVILVTCSYHFPFFEHFLFWPKMLQAHLVLTLPQPWNQPWFLLVGVVLETKTWYLWFMWGALIFFFIKNLFWSQTK